jgi:hypothetical protein
MVHQSKWGNISMEGTVVGKMCCGFVEDFTMSLVGDKSSVWILWLPCGGRKSSVGAESGAGMSAAQDRGDPGAGTRSVRWPAAGGVG